MLNLPEIEARFNDGFFVICQKTGSFHEVCRSQAAGRHKLYHVNEESRMKKFLACEL